MFNVYFSSYYSPIVKFDSWYFFPPDWHLKAFPLANDILLLALPTHVKEMNGATAKNYTDDI